MCALLAQHGTHLCKPWGPLGIQKVGHLMLRNVFHAHPSVLQYLGRARPGKNVRLSCTKHVCTCGEQTMTASERPRKLVLSSCEQQHAGLHAMHHTCTRVWSAISKHSPGCTCSGTRMQRVTHLGLV